MKFSVLIGGSGTSHGIPVIGCECKTCKSCDSRDKRFRSMCFVKSERTTVAIDAGQEFRLQCLANSISKIDAVLLTHAHADHIFGLDDLRVFSYPRMGAHLSIEERKKALDHLMHPSPVAIYANGETVENMKKTFHYAFETTQLGGGKPAFSLRDCDANSAEKPVEIGDLRFVPIEMLHGNVRTTGWRCGDFAYLTDLNAMPPSSMALLDGVKTAVIDGLRVRPHTTHFNFVEAMSLGDKIGCEKLFITHICHNHSHREIEAFLSESKRDFPSLRNAVVAPAFDGMKFECNLK